MNPTTTSSLVKTRKKTGGLQNGASRLFLAAFQVQVPEHVFFLINTNSEFQILKQFSDPEGRFVITDVKTEGKILTLAKNLCAK